MLHFVPLDNNVYVYFRFLQSGDGGIDKSKPVVMVMLNFSDKEEEIALPRFEEIISGYKIVRSIIGNHDCSKKCIDLITIGAHDIMILELNKYD